MSITERLSTALADRYTIERQLGEGGMATVYLAHDLKHDRKVAVKVLRPELSAILGGERFLNEIKVTANLQHPNILPLYDSGEADTFLYYVMPYMEGETLREKMGREKQLGVEETLDIGKAVSAALQFAHERGVVHRDIKPENILLQSGQPLVADFGIALAVSAAGGTRLTETGLSLGTPHYMSPEQAMGDREVDARSDVYSLGAMVYEMLVGEPPHIGTSVQAIIARILSDEPERVTKHRPSVPPHLDAAIAKALDKTPADRFTSAAKFAEAMTDPGFTLATTRAAAMSRVDGAGRWNRLTVVLGALTTLFLGTTLWSWFRPEAPRSVIRQQIVLGNVGQNLGDIRYTLAVAPDGSAIVYVDSVGDGTQLVLKPRDQDLATPLSGTNGAVGPFFSPDGAWIGFMAEGRLRKVPRGGGGSVTLADSTMMTTVGFGTGAWLDNDTILFPDASFNLRKVSAAGGPATVVVEGVNLLGGVVDVWPLPGARGALLTSCNLNCAESAVHVFDAALDTVRVLFEAAQGVWYVPTGHVIYADRQGGAFAAPFDLVAMAVSGAAVPAIEGLRAPDLAFGADGTLIYVVGRSAIGEFNTAELVWVDRSGAITAVDPGWQFGLPATAPAVSVSPDGTRLALGMLQAGAENIWIKQTDRAGGPLSRLTFGEDGELVPRWTPDGASVIFTTLGGDAAVYSKAADGTGTVELLLDMDQQITEARWTSDGEWLLLRAGRGAVNVRDIWGLRPGMDSLPLPLLTESFDEISPTVSPDGKWLAYASNETGRFEVYVRPFPETDSGRWQISTNGGTEPVWARSGGELFYLGPNEMIVVQLETEPAFQTGQQRSLFPFGPEYVRGNGYTAYDISANDQRFVIARNIARVSDRQGDDTKLIFVENWFEELKAKVGR